MTAVANETITVPDDVSSISDEGTALHAFCSVCFPPDIYYAAGQVATALCGTVVTNTLSHPSQNCHACDDLYDQPCPKCGAV